MKLALGTAQFGLQYGIANSSGRLSAATAAAVLARARAAGMDTLDTAAAYGDSEERLGAIGVADWRVVTKLPSLPTPCDDVRGWVLAAVRSSLARLGLPAIFGLLLHRPEQLLEESGAQIYAALQELKALGLVQKIGISIYDPVELDALWARFPCDLVQAPFNLLDRRLVTSGWMLRLAAAGAELHVRSIFLQGLLLMAPEQRPAMFRRWAQVWTSLDRWFDETGLSPLQACLRDALAVREVDRVVVGVDSLPHLAEILGAAAGDVPAVPDGWPGADRDLINPARWGALA